MPTLCRDCLTIYDDGRRCVNCKSPRVIAHPELLTLGIAHMDCDAFYASVEKRDNPELMDKPVIIGGGKRGVVSTACYIARLKGVRSAMPMFQALKRCPEAVIVKPRMEVYAAVSRAIRDMMTDLTPSIEPLSLDEAFLDLRGTQKLHGKPPVVLLNELIARMYSELGLTGSIGLSHNKFLAKIASDLNKPRGFSLIGKAETDSFLSGKSVSLIWGVGAVTRATLEQDGIRTFTDLLERNRDDLIKRYGEMGLRLFHLARGQDYRRVSANAPVKSISNETTFFEDTADIDVLEGHLWRLSEKVSDRAKAKDKSGRVVTLKLKRQDFTQISRRVSLREPTQIADHIFRTAKSLFSSVSDQGPFRLIGVGLSQISTTLEKGDYRDLIDFQGTKRAEVERATDKIRKKFGAAAIMKGRALR
jgi:DNA polymerase-4